MAQKYIIPTVFTAEDKFSAVMSGMVRDMKEYSAAAQHATMKYDVLGNRATEIAKKSGLTGAGLLAPIGLSIKYASDFEDKLAEVAKTTGLSGQGLELYGQQVRELAGSTRSSLQDLMAIGEVAGQMGIANNQLYAFTKSANEFAVALGKDYSGGVEEAIGSVTNAAKLYWESRAEDIPVAMTKIGSAINELSAAGNASAPNITDFINRVGTLPEAMRPGIGASIAMGGVLEELGLKSEIASSGFSAFLLDASRNLPIVAAQMHMATTEAQRLLKVDPGQFALRYAKGLPGDAASMAQMLKGAGIGSSEQIRVLGALQSASALYGQRLQLVNDAYAKGTSLGNEYNTMNNTTAAQLAKVSNNMEALAITVGTQVVPVFNDYLQSAIAGLSATSRWASQHETFTKTVLYSAGAIGGSMLLVSGASATYAFAMKGAAFATNAYNFATGVASVRAGTLNAALGATRASALGAEFAVRIMSMTMGQWALAAGGIALLIGGINYAFDTGYNPAVKYKDMLEEQQIGFKKIKQPISEAEIALNRYNSAVGEYNELQDMVNKRDYLKKRYEQSKGLDKVGAALEFVAANVINNFTAPFMSDKVNDVRRNRIPIERFKPDTADFLNRDQIQMIQLQRAVDSTNNPEMYNTNKGGDQKVSVVIRNESSMDVSARGTSGVEIKNMHSWGNNAV